MMALARFRPAAAAGNRRGIRRSPRRHSTGPGPAPAPDPELLAYLVCPLSRRRLRSVRLRGGCGQGQEGGEGLVRRAECGLSTRPWLLG